MLVQVGIYVLCDFEFISPQLPRFLSLGAAEETNFQTFGRSEVLHLTSLVLRYMGISCQITKYSQFAVFLADNGPDSSDLLSTVV
jgi:hypothetical protein